MRWKLVDDIEMTAHSGRGIAGPLASQAHHVASGMVLPCPLLIWFPGVEW